MAKTPAFLFALLLLAGITNAFAFENSRPSAYAEFNCREDTANTDDEASLGLGLHVFEYRENYPEDDDLGVQDHVELRIAATANTRKGINYGQSRVMGLFDWVEATSDTGIVGSNHGKWFNLDFPLRFYGGPGHSNVSNEYRRVWVSSNGFLSFTDNSTSPDPKQIPDPTSPNALLAVYWSSFVTFGGGAIKYYSDSSMFVVLWDNVLNVRNNVRQTFEVIIESFMVPSPVRGQSRITFLYESVTWSSDAIVGIEDQEGCKGSVASPYPTSGEGVLFASLTEAPEIKRITIKLQKSDNQAIIRISQDYWSLVGHNVKIKNREDRDSNGLVEKAISGYGSLLVSTALKAALHATAVGGFVIGLTLVTIPFVIQAAHDMHPANVPPADIHDAYENDGLASVSAAAETSPYPNWGWPVDALIGMKVYWIFTDHNTCDHSMTVSAELEYYSYVTGSTHNLTTNQPLTVTFLHEIEPKLVNPPVCIKASLGVDDQIDDFRFWVGGTNTIKADMDPPASSDFDLELLGPSGNVIAYSRNRSNETIETIDHELQYANDFYTIRVIFYGGQNDFYTLNLRVVGEWGSGGAPDPPPLMCAW